MIVSLPAVVFLCGAIAAYLRTGLLRVLGTIAMLLAAAWSMAFITPWQPAAAWLVGPLLATLLIFRPASRNRLSFEQITRRAITLAATTVVAIFAATKFPIGENGTVLSAVPWLLAALGAAWTISPIDEEERVQADVLLVAAGSAVLMMAVPVGPFTAAACGAMALLPAIAFRWTPPERGEELLRVLLLVGAGAVVAAAILMGSPPRPSLLDLALSLDGPALAAVALLLLAGAFLGAPGRSWPALPGLLAVLALSPGLRWAALAGLVATSFRTERRDERLAWLALLLLASSTLFAVLVAQPWSPRAQIVAMAVALVLSALSAAASRPLAIAFFALLLVIYQNTSGASALLISRFQWVAAAGALLLVARALLARNREKSEGVLDDALIFGLLLLAAAAHDPAGLGALASVLLLLEIMVRRSISSRPQAAPGSMSWLLELTRTGWPGTVRFAGVTLAVVASLQTSLAAGLLAALLLAGLKLHPLVLVSPARASIDGEPFSVRAYLSPALSFACGLAPALVLRILRV